MAQLNYAEKYLNALTAQFPYVLRFGALWNAVKPEVNFVDAKTVHIPTLRVGGRQNGNRDTIGQFTRNFDNGYETKTLSRHRVWQTLVHPKDIIETNQVATIGNITNTMNLTQKFPEMDAIMITSLYKNKNDIEAITANAKDSLTVDNVLTIFDGLMDEMDEAGVPSAGRLLYVDTYTKTLIDNAIQIIRSSGESNLNRGVSRIDEVEVISVPTKAMKSSYDFTENGFEVSAGAKNVKLLLVHPIVVIPTVSYEFAQLGEPSSLSQGKWTYFEESFEDVFTYDELIDGLSFYVENAD